MRTVFIYALVSSRENDDRVWYVGQSVDVHGRFERHHLKDGSGNRKAVWIRREHADGFEVRPRILEECETATADAREAYWIAFFRALNPELTNGTAGADSARAGYLETVKEKQRAQLAIDRAWLSTLKTEDK